MNKDRKTYQCDKFSYLLFFFAKEINCFFNKMHIYLLIYLTLKNNDLMEFVYFLKFYLNIFE